MLQGSGIVLNKLFEIQKCKSIIQFFDVWPLFKKNDILIFTINREYHADILQ